MHYLVDMMECQLALYYDENNKISKMNSQEHHGVKMIINTSLLNYVYTEVSIVCTL